MEPCQPKPLARWNTARDVWETPGTEGLLCEHLDVFSETFPTSGTTRNGTAYALPTSEPATDDGECSYLPTPTVRDYKDKPHPTGTAPAERHGHPVAGAGGPDLTLLPTPAAGLFNDGESAEAWLARRERVKLTANNGNGMGTPLSIAVQLLPTPRATDGTKGGPNQRGSSGDLMLPSAVVQLLPTPTSSDANGAGAHGTGGKDLRTSVALLPTPTTTQRGTDANLDTREGARANLHNEVAKLLPTPRATNNENRQNEHRYGPNLGMALGVTPGYEARLLPTPTGPAPHDSINSAGRIRPDRGGYGKELTTEGVLPTDGQSWGDYAAAIARHERALGRPAPNPTEPGPKGNPRLSAAFCEWMMMLPAGWVTDCGLTRNQALKALGNGVVPLQAAHALSVMLDRIDGRTAA